MGILKKFKDSTFQCWSRVDLPNGDPIWISIAQTGVLIKKSKLGLKGEVLYQSKDIELISRLGARLSLSLNEFDTPENMKNVPLKVFTQIALESSSIEEFCSRISLAEEEALGEFLEEEEGWKAILFIRTLAGK